MLLQCKVETMDCSSCKFVKVPMWESDSDSAAIDSDDEHDDKIPNNRIRKTKKSKTSRKLNVQCLQKPFNQIRNGQIDEVLEFIKTPVFDPKIQDTENSLTLLHCAIRYQQHELALELLKLDTTDVKIAEHNGKTPFHYICEFSKTNGKNDEVYKLLNEIKQKDEDFLEKKDKFGKTGIEIAASHGNFEVTKLLLNEYKPTVSKKEVVKYLCSAGQSGDKRIVNLILDESQLDLSGEELGQFVQKAAENGHFHLLERYSKDKLPNDVAKKEDSYKNTLLHLAVYSGSIAAVEWVLKLEVSYERNSNGDYPIHLAARFNLSEILKIILEKFHHASSVNEENNKKETALFIASKNNYKRIVDQLVDIEGIDLNKPNESGNTPLMAAAEKDCIEIVNILLDKGAKCDVLNNDFQNVLHLVARNGMDTTFKRILDDDLNCHLLQDKEIKKGETPIHKIVREGKELLFEEYILTKNLDPNIIAARNFNGETPCHVAAKRQRMSILKSIVQKFPFTLNIKNNKDYTPLQVAAAYGKIECVEFLLNSKFSGNDLDINKRILCIASKNGHHKLVKHLLENHKYKEVDVKEAFWEAFKSNHGLVLETLLCSNFGLQILEENYSDENNMAAIIGLIKCFPDIAESVMDRCIIKDDNEKMKPKFQYVDMDDEISDKCCFRSSYKSVDNHPLMIMALERHEHLLMHPLTLLWIKKQWKSYGRCMFLIEFIPYILYITFLSLYALKVQDNHSFARDMNDTEWNEMTQEEKTAIFENEHQYSLHYKIAVTLSTVLCCLYEVFQLYHMKRMYFCQWSNLLDVVMYFTTLAIVWDIGISIPMTYCYSNECWKWPVSAILLLCVWLNFLRYLKFFSFFGIFLLMFVRTLKTVVKLGLMLGIFIFAFSISLHMTLMDHRPFQGFWWGYLKTVSMSLGEFTYDEIFRAQDRAVKFHTATIATFVALIVIMTIVLMNMLIGIAVDNISKVQADAEVERVVSQIKVVLRFKRIKITICPEKFAAPFVKVLGYLTNLIKNIDKQLPDWLTFNTTYFMTTKNIKKAWDARQKNKLKTSAEIEELEELVERLQRKISSMKK